VNDRGPFLHDRLIDLSYAAAHRLGIAQRGSGEVEVEAIVPGAAATSVMASTPLPPVEAVPVVAAATVVASAPVVATPLETRAPVVAAAPVASPAGDAFAVQLGAFGSYANATNFLSHVQNQLATAQVEARVRQSGGLYRVYVGPYADRDEARRVGERITQAFGYATTVAPH